MFSVSKNIFGCLLLSMAFLKGLSGQTITPLIPPDQSNSGYFLVDEFGNQLAVPLTPTTSTAAVGVAQYNDTSESVAEIFYTVYDTSIPEWTLMTAVPNTQYDNPVQTVALSPQIQSDHYGNVVLCWIDPQGNLLASLLPAGQTAWTDFATIDSQVSLASLAALQTPVGSVNSFFTVAYVKESGSQSTILTSEYNLGQNWSAPAVVTTLTGEVGFLDLAVNQTMDEATGYALTWELTNGATSTIGVAASFSNPPINWVIFDGLTPISGLSQVVEGNVFPQCVISPANVPLFTWLTTNTQGIYGVFTVSISGVGITFLEFIPLNVNYVSLKYMRPQIAVDLSYPPLQAMLTCVQISENALYIVYNFLCVLYTLNEQGDLIVSAVDLPPITPLESDNFCAPANPVFSEGGAEITVCGQNLIFDDPVLFYVISTATAPVGQAFSPLETISQPMANSYLPRFGMNNHGDIFALWFQDPVKGTTLGYGEMFGYAAITPSP